MVLEVKVLEDFHVGNWVSLLFNDSNQVFARKSTPKEAPDAIAAREILRGDLILFDTGRDTLDLLRPSSDTYQFLKKDHD